MESAERRDFEAAVEGVVSDSEKRSRARDVRGGSLETEVVRDSNSK